MSLSNLNTAGKFSISIIVTAFLLIFFGCSDTVYQSESIDEPDHLKIGQMQNASADNLKCQTVSGSIEQSGTPLSGNISGDIEGTVATEATGPFKAQGSALFLPGIQTWEVTGGIVDPLIGNTIQLNVDVVGVKPPQLRINTTARIVEGARRGNLTYHGTTDLSNPMMPTSSLEYHGVICP